MAAARKSSKLDRCSAHTASRIPAIEESAASAKPRARPILRISSAAGIVVAAIATTIIDKGSVASALSGLSVAPMMPPSMTMTMEPVAEINWQMTRITRLALNAIRIGPLERLLATNSTRSE